MKIAIDISPLKTGHFLQHRVRGTGFYLNNLKKSLLKYYPDNKYIFFTRGEKLPENVDLVHFPYFEPFFLTLPIYKKYKTVVTVHDLTPIVFSKHFPRGIKGELKWQMQRYALKRVNLIITDSNSSKEDINRCTSIPASKIHVVYLAAGEEFKEIHNSESKIQNLRKKYNLPERFVLYVGDATWNKNLPRLMRAVKSLKLPLVMVGKALVSKDYDRSNPWNNDLVKGQQEAETNPLVARIGFIPTDDLVAIYNLATVFVMPSLYEGFGLPVLEAMSCGCPVITSREGSLEEIAKDAAYYVDAYSTDSIAEGIKEVFSNTKLQKELSDKGLAQSKKFSWKKTAEETIKVYKKVLGIDT